MMSLNCSFNTLPIEKILSNRGLNDNGRVQKYIDREVIRLMQKYTPLDNGALIRSATMLTDIGSGLVQQGGAMAPYGRKWYYTEANFQDAPTRGTYWFERMKKNGGSQSIFDGAKRECGAR